MPRRVGTSRNPAKDVSAAIRALLVGAVARLDDVAAAPADHDTADDTAVHEVRKRCKEARALARLLGRPTGSRAGRFDAAVRDAGRAVSSLRDAQAVTGTLDTLSASATGRAHTAIMRVRAAEREADRTTANPAADAAVAVERLTAALAELERWRPDPGFRPIADGVERAYRAGRRGLAALQERPDDEHMHEWRKAVKRLWYQARAVRDLAPSALGPMVDVLDELSELLGDDHDLAVVVERITGAPGTHGGDRAVAGTVAAARARQAELRARSIRLGATVFAERPSAFRTRIESYWALTSELGPEPVAAG
jgi:CHAD domain-containing protein